MNAKRMPFNFNAKRNFPNMRMQIAFEGGAIYIAEKNCKFYVISDERTMADLLGPEDQDLLDELVNIYEFDTEKERERFLRKYPYKRSGAENIMEPCHQGLATKEIAILLKHSLGKDSELKHLEICYDHGDRKISENVCQPTTYMGRRYGSDATLSGLDIVVKLRRKVLVVAEIEERTARPKTILGDIFAVVLADNAMISGDACKLRDVELLIAMITPEKGKIAEKLVRLERHANKYIKVLRDSGRSQSVRKVHIEPVSENDFIQCVEKRLRWIVKKKFRSWRAAQVA